MAYIDDPRKKQQAALPGAGGGATSASAPAGGAPQGPSQPRAQPGQKGTGFVNLQTMLSLNRPQAAASAQTLAGQVGAGAEQAKAQGQGVVDAFGRKVQAGTPTSPAPDAAYKGPTDISREDGYLAAQRGLQRAEDRAVAGVSQGGREALLDTYRPGMSAGESRLSAALMGGAAPEAFGGLRGTYGNLSGMMGPAGQALVDSARATAQAQKDAYVPPPPAAPGAAPGAAPVKDVEDYDDLDGFKRARVRRKTGGGYEGEVRERRRQEREGDNDRSAEEDENLLKRLWDSLH